MNPLQFFMVEKQRFPKFIFGFCCLCKYIYYLYSMKINGTYYTPKQINELINQKED